MINEKESKKTGICSQLLKLLSRDMKKKQQHKDQLAGIKNNRKIKAMGYITHTMNRYPRNGTMGDTDP